MKLILDLLIILCDAYVTDDEVVPAQVLEVIQHAKSTCLSEVSTHPSDSRGDPSENLISSLRTLSSISTYLDTYFEIHPLPTRSDENKMGDDADPFDHDKMDIDSQSQSEFNPTILSDLFAAIPLIVSQPLSVPLIPYALETINDISWTMTLRIPESEEWRTTSQQFLTFAVPRIEGIAGLGEDTLSTFLGCIWATAKAIPGRFSLDPEDIQLLESLYGQYPSAEFQAKIMGILGLAAQTESADANKYITAFMMREITSPTKLVIVEIMDAIMEIFADGEKVYDIPVFVQGQVLLKLKEVLPQLRKRVKGIHPDKESDLRERADGVLENFVEFIKYKEAEAKAR